MKTQQEFDENEQIWRQRLAGRSLVIEANGDPTIAATAFRVLGTNFERVHTKERRVNLLKHYGASLVIGLCTVGAREYDEGIFWPSVAEAFGTPLRQAEQQQISEAFRNALDSFGLSRFETPLRNIGEILMHSGVPIPSVESFCRVLLHRDSLTNGLDGRQFGAWARTMSRGLASSIGLDAPTWRFLTEGGEVAEDFTDRCLAVLDTRGNSDGSTAQDGLPVAVVDELQRLIVSGALLASRKRGPARRNDGDLYPKLVFDRANGIRIKLPSLEIVTESELLWRIRAEGRSATIRVSAPWPGDPYVARYENVSSPAKVVSVTVEPSAQTWELELVDVDDPLLVFDATTGEWIPARNSLPKGSVWLIFANKSSAPIETSIDVDGVLKIIQVAESPYGWDGWTFAEVDLGESTRVRLSLSERWRFVTTVTRPQLSEPEHIEGITMPDGRAVFASRPLVRLPAAVGSQGASIAAISWAVTVTDITTGDVKSTAVFESEPSPRLVDPWPRDPERLLGDFEVSVRGPLGRGFRTKAAVAEGVEVTSTTQFRAMNTDGTGLEVAQMRVSVPPSEAGTSPTVALGAQDKSKLITLEAESQHLSVSASITFMSVGLRGMFEKSPGTTPLRLDLESLDDAILRVVIPAGVRADLAALSGGQLLQTVIAGDGQHGGARSYNLAQLSETLTTHGGAQLTLGIDGRQIPLAIVRPRNLATAVVVSADGVLDLIGATHVPGLTCAIYPYFAPWVKPTIITFSHGSVSVQLDARLMNEGQARVQVRAEDPWDPNPWPDLPDLASANLFTTELGPLVDKPGYPDSGFRDWLAGHGECPQYADSVPTALTIFSRLHRFTPLVNRKILRQELAIAVRSNRELVVQSVLETDARAKDLMQFFVESDVVTVPGEAWASSPLLWSYSVALGILADSDLWVTEEKAEFENALSKYVGDSGSEILKHGRDPLCSIGRFDANAVRMYPWPQDRIDALWDVTNPLPGRFLEKDPRATGAKELFDHRNDREVRELSGQTQRLLSQARSILTRVVGPQAVKPLEARVAADGWRDLPALSLAFGLCARLAARGHQPADEFYQTSRSLYANMAHAAPSIVERDLALAELWVTRWSAS